MLLPIVGLLLVTSEWSQRTALTTFTLVPERSRVVVAKLLAGSALALVAVLVCLAVAAAGNLIAGGSWNFELSHLGEGALYELFGMLGALALGLLLMHSALAIVTYFVLPTVVGHRRRGRPRAPRAGRSGSTRTRRPRRSPRARSTATAGRTSPSPSRSGSCCRWSLGLLRLRRHELK